jgi:protein gp37
VSENSKIEWTHHTFNPWWGCAKVSPGCDHCYAEALGNRFGTPWGVDAERREFGEKHWDEPRKWNAKAAAAGERHRVFCASMADVFDKNAPSGARQRLLSLIADTPHLDWLLLTKRIGNASRMLQEACMHDGRLMDANDQYRALPNLWLGISVVNQEEADRDIPKLLRVPAAVRFLSMEPLLGPVNLWRIGGNKQYVIDALAGVMRSTAPISIDPSPPENLPSLNWVIVGGESGPNARPMHPDWARSLRDQCAAAGVPFFFKQWGESIAGELAPNPDYPGDKGAWRLDQSGRRWHDPFEASKPHSEWEPVVFMKVGKKAAGRLLDGVVHNEFPKVAA